VTGGWPELGTLKGNVEKVAAARSQLRRTISRTLYLVHDGTSATAVTIRTHNDDQRAAALRRVEHALRRSNSHFVFRRARISPADQGSGRETGYHDDVTDRVYFATGGQFNAAPA
jgi:hypothetical protein